MVSFFKDIEVEIERPKVYLYSTHQTEEYKDSDVYQISLDFKNILNNKRIDVDVEDTKVMDVVKSKGLKYKDSYKVTRALIEDRLDEYDLYIDIHRDSSKWSGSTTTIDGVNYARVMFVIGKGHDNYQFNYDLCSALNKLLKNYDSSLSRGIYVRDGSSYNQDLNKNVILMELGGVENTSEEVNNTLNILADVFEYYLYE